MKTRQAKKIQRLGAGKMAKPTHEEISRLAYLLFEREGKPVCKDLEHWFNAESMIESNFGYGNDHTEHDFSTTPGDK